MKKITKLLTAFIFLTSLAIAADLMSLKANMKQANLLLKAVTASVTDTSKNADNAIKAQQMADYFLAARNQSPGVGVFAEYQSLMDQEIVLFNELKSAFTNSNNTDAQAIIQKINIIKKEGHDKFN